MTDANNVLNLKSSMKGLIGKQVNTLIFFVLVLCAWYWLRGWLDNFCEAREADELIIFFGSVAKWFLAVIGFFIGMALIEYLFYVHRNHAVIDFAAGTITDYTYSFPIQSNKKILRFDRIKKANAPKGSIVNLFGIDAGDVKLNFAVYENTAIKHESWMIEGVAGAYEAAEEIMEKSKNFNGLTIRQDVEK